MSAGGCEPEKVVAMRTDSVDRGSADGHLKGDVKGGLRHAEVHPDVGSTMRLLMSRHPESAAAIRQSGRLAAGLVTLKTVSGLSAEEMADLVGSRELTSAKRPVDVLVSRCMEAVRDLAGSDGAAPTRPEDRTTTPAVDLARFEPTAEPVPNGASSAHATPSPNGFSSQTAKPAATPMSFITAQTSPTRRRRTPRRGVLMTPPTVAGEVAERVALPIVGNRYLAVVGAVGGAGASTVSTLLGQVLATCRSDRVVLADAAAMPGGVGELAGIDTQGALRKMLAAETSIHGCAELARFVGRTTNRLDIAGLGPADNPLTADEYRRVSAMLSRFYDLLITDAGSVPSLSAMVPVLGITDLVVVVAPATAHGLRNLDRLLDALLDDGNLVPSQTLVAINGLHRRSSVDVAHIRAVVADRCSSLTTIPWDPHLAPGSTVDLRGLHPTTLRAVTAAASALVDALNADPK
jgi:MinD-like ATPase involved in chromosome partitioning or flagellar assembly